MEIKHEVKVQIVRQTRVTKSGSKKLVLPYGQLSLRDKLIEKYIGQKVTVTITTKEAANQ